MGEKKWFFERYRGYFLIFTISGILMVLWGASIKSNSQSQLLIAIGAAVVGANLSLFFGSLTDFEITDILKKSLKANFSSDEKAIDKYRKEYHCYRVTEFEEGKPVWQYSLLDFRNFVGNGILYAKEKNLNSENKECHYALHAGIRDQGLIIFKKAIDSEESTAILIFPSFRKGYEPHHSGIYLHEAWTRDEKIDPILISSEPICNVTEEKKISDRIEKELSKCWRKGITKTNFENLGLGVESMEKIFTS